MADARDRDVLRTDGAPHVARRVPPLLGRPGHRARADRVRFAELGSDRGAARDVPPPVVPGRASAVAAVAMVRVVAGRRARGGLPLDPALSGSAGGVDRSDGAEPARDRRARSVPRRRAGVDPRDPHRGDRFADVARAAVPPIIRDRTTPAAMAAHGGGFRGGALFGRDDRVARELLGRRGRSGLDHAAPEHRDPVVRADPARDRRVDPALPLVRHRRRDQQGGAVRSARGVHHGRVRRDHRRRRRDRRRADEPGTVRGGGGGRRARVPASASSGATTGRPPRVREAGYAVRGSVRILGARRTDVRERGAAPEDGARAGGGHRRGARRRVGACRRRAATRGDVARGRRAAAPAACVIGRGGRRDGCIDVRAGPASWRAARCAVDREATGRVHDGDRGEAGPGSGGAGRARDAERRR